MRIGELLGVFFGNSIYIPECLHLLASPRQNSDILLFVCSNLNRIAPQTHGSAISEQKNPVISDLRRSRPNEWFQRKEPTFRQWSSGSTSFGTWFFSVGKTSCWWSEIPRPKHRLDGQQKPCPLIIGHLPDISTDRTPDFRTITSTLDAYPPNPGCNRSLVAKTSRFRDADFSA